MPRRPSNCNRPGFPTVSPRLEAAAERRETRRKRLADCHEIEVRIADTRAKANRESQVNRLVALNLEITRLEARLAELATEL